MATDNSFTISCRVPFPVFLICSPTRDQVLLNCVIEMVQTYIPFSYTMMHTDTASDYSACSEMMSGTSPWTSDNLTDRSRETIYIACGEPTQSQTSMDMIMNGRHYKTAVILMCTSIDQMPASVRSNAEYIVYGAEPLPQAVEALMSDEELWCQKKTIGSLYCTVVDNLGMGRGPHTMLLPYPSPRMVQVRQTAVAASAKTDKEAAEEPDVEAAALESAKADLEAAAASLESAKADMQAAAAALESAKADKEAAAALRESEKAGLEAAAASLEAEEAVREMERQRHWAEWAERAERAERSGRAEREAREAQAEKTVFALFETAWMRSIRSTNADATPSQINAQALENVQDFSEAAIASAEQEQEQEQEEEEEEQQEHVPFNDELTIPATNFNVPSIDPLPSKPAYSPIRACRAQAQDQAQDQDQDNAWDDDSLPDLISADEDSDNEEDRWSSCAVRRDVEDNLGWVLTPQEEEMLVKRMETAVTMSESAYASQTVPTELAQPVVDLDAEGDIFAQFATSTPVPAPPPAEDELRQAMQTMQDTTHKLQRVTDLLQSMFDNGKKLFGTVFSCMEPRTHGGIAKGQAVEPVHVERKGQRKDHRKAAKAAKAERKEAKARRKARRKKLKMFRKRMSYVAADDSVGYGIHMQHVREMENVEACNRLHKFQSRSVNLGNVQKDGGGWFVPAEDVSASSGLFFVPINTREEKEKEDQKALDAWFNMVQKLQDQRYKRMRRIQEAADARTALSRATANLRNVQRMMNEAEYMVDECVNWVQDTDIQQPLVLE